MSLKDKSGDTLSANQIPLASMSNEPKGPMFAAYYVPRVLYSLCLCFQILYSRHSMFPVPMFPVSIFQVLWFCVYVPRVLYSLHLCSQRPMFPAFYVHNILCSQGPMFPASYVLGVLCYRYPRFPWSYLHRVLRSPLLCSQNLTPESFVPRVTCSECPFSWCLYS